MPAVAAWCGVAALALGVAAPPAGQLEQAAAVARPGLVLVTVSWHGWVRDKATGEVFGGVEGYTAKSTCTGFVVSPDGYVATASHCVHTGPDGGAGLLFDAAIEDLRAVDRAGSQAGARRALAERATAEGAVPDRPVERIIQVERMELDGEGKPVRDTAPAEVVELVAPDDGDVAVLKVPRDHLPSLELKADEPPVGSPVLAIGYPTPIDRNLEPSSRDGLLAARKALGDRPFHEVTAPTTPRMSGGPVVDEQGRVVGVLSRDGLASATSTLRDLLRGKGISTDSGPLDRNYRAGVERYFDDDFSGAVAFFDAVPTHPQAAEFRRRAVERGGAAGVGGPTPLVWFAVFSWTLVAAAAAGLLLLRRTRRLSEVDTSTSPILLGVLPEADGDDDADEAEERDGAPEETDEQAEPGDGHVQAGAPDLGEPGATESDEGDDARHRREDRSP